MRGGKGWAGGPAKGRGSTGRDVGGEWVWGACSEARSRSTKGADDAGRK